jgi:hypothetical protein
MDNKAQKGYWIDDQFLSFIKGHSRYEETNRDAMQFTAELRDTESLFPYKDPSELFIIKHPGTRIATILNDQFITRHRRTDSLYGNFPDIGMFLGSIYADSAKLGFCSFAIDWGIDETSKLMLVTDLRYLRSSTMHVKKSANGVPTGYMQKYSRLAYLSKKIGEENKPIKFTFKPDEVFYITYPFGNPPPVQGSMSLLNRSQRYFRFILEYGQAQISSKGLKWAEERARYKNYTKEYREFLLTRAQISKNFHQFDSIRKLTLNDYYDVYILSRYMADKVRARQYFVDEFNKQILLPLAHKNGIKRAPTLAMINLSSKEDVDDLRSAYENKTIDYQEFIELFTTLK